MLATILLSVGFFLLAMGAMGLGVAISGKRLQGSCGGAGGEACRCSEEKRASCERMALRAAASVASAADEDDHFALAPLAPPGEQRLVQLGRRSMTERDSRAVPAAPPFGAGPQGLSKA